MTIGNLIGYLSFMLIIIGLYFLLIFKKTLHYRLLMFKKKFHAYKWMGWFIEIIYFPIMMNIVEYATC